MVGVPCLHDGTLSWIWSVWYTPVYQRVARLRIWNTSMKATIQGNIQTIPIFCTGSAGLEST